MRTDTLSIGRVENVNRCRNKTDFKLSFAGASVVGMQTIGARIAKKDREARKLNKTKEQGSVHNDDGCWGCSERTDLESLVERERFTLVS